MSSEILHFLFIHEKYDIEVAFLEGYATKIIAGASQNTKTIAWVHCDVTKTEWITGVFRKEEEFIECYKKIDEVISVSKSVQDAFIERFGEITNLSVRYNPVTDEHIRKLAEQQIDLVASDNKVTLISLGRMTYQKNFLRLLRAVKKMLALGFAIELWLLGTGEEYEKLQKYVKDNYLQEHVKLLGFQMNPYPYMKQADLYVCSSLYEGFSTAATEALVLGVPVLTTDVSGMKEMLGSNEYGIITENTDEAFEDGLKKIISHKELLRHYKEKAIERGSFFEFDKRMEEIENLFWN